MTKKPKQIADMIDLLKLQRQAIPRMSGFGDNNHEQIDSQVSVLERAKKMDAFEIEDARDGAASHASEYVLSAWDWLCGDGDDLVEADDHWVERARAANKAAKAK